MRACGPLLFVLVNVVASVSFASDARLADAAMNRDKTAMRALLNQKADVNQPRRMAPQRCTGRRAGTTSIPPDCCFAPAPM